MSSGVCRIAANPPRQQARQFPGLPASAITFRSAIDSGVVLVLLACALVIFPLLPPGIPATADGPLHLIRSVEFNALLRQGVLYPRWAPDLAFGYGYPLFNYYAPLFYYVVEVPRLLGASVELALKLTIFFAIVVYGLAPYWWLRPILGPIPAAVAGVAYLFVPFRYHEAYAQGDYPQFLAFALAPLALGAIHRVVTAERWSFGRFTLAVGCVGAIVMVHNISTLWIGPTLALYSLALIGGLAIRDRNGEPSGPTLRRLLGVVGVAIFALGLTAFFWLPAMGEQSLVQLARLRTDDFDVRNAFLTAGMLFAGPAVVDQAAANPPPYFHLGWGQLILAGLTIPLLARRIPAWARPDSRPTWNVLIHGVFGWILLIASAAMTLPVSDPVWRRIPILAYTEYPWRLLELSGLATALLAGIAVHLALDLMSRFQSGLLPRVSGVALSLLLLVVPSLVYSYPRRPFLVYGNLTTADVTAFERTGGAVGTTSAGEYFPTGVVAPPTNALPADVDRIGHLDRSILPPDDRATFGGSVGLTERYDVTLGRPATLRFNVLDFAGWQVLVDGHPVATRAQTGDGLLLADVPAGAHALVLAFGDTPLRRDGWVLAVMSVALLLGVGLYTHLRRGARQSWPAQIAGQSIAWNRVNLERGGGWLLCAGFLLVIALRVTSPLPYQAIFERRSPPDRVLGTIHPLSIDLDDKIRLLGYDLGSSTARPGETFKVTLYWRPLHPLQTDYRSLAMIARIGDKGLLTQDDRPNPGKTPSHAWTTDQYVIDEHVISVPLAAPPMVYQVQVALYDPKTLAHLRQNGIDGWQGEQVVLQQVHVSRPAPVDPSTYHALGDPVFGGILQLRGYQLASTRVRPGSALDFTLIWRANRTVDHDYTIFTHLIDANQKQVAGSDSMPRDGQYPTSDWLVGDDVVDPHPLVIPSSLLPGSYHLAFGVYDAKTGQRLDATAKGWNGSRSQIDLDDIPIVVEAAT